MKPIEEIRAAFHIIHRVATGQSDRAYMSIPARPEHDADLIVSAALDELALLRRQRAALAEALHEMMAAHRRADPHDIDSCSNCLGARAALSGRQESQDCCRGAFLCDKHWPGGGK